MATRSTIALEYADGTVYQIYAHWDGYLEHNGKMLFEHYSDPFKLDELIQSGSLSSLAPNIGTKHSFDHNPKGQCNFYGRDRGETGTEAYSFTNYAEYVKEHQYEEFEYILRQVEGKAVWFVSETYGGGKYRRLEQALNEIAAAEAN